MEEPPQPPPPPYLSLIQNCIISSSQEDLLDQKGFAFSDTSHIHLDGQIDEELEQPSLPLDNTEIRICSLDDSTSSSSSDDDEVEDITGGEGGNEESSLNRKNLGFLQCGDDSIDRVKMDTGNNNKIVIGGSGEDCGVESSVKRIRLMGECSIADKKRDESGDKKEKSGEKKEESESGEKPKELKDEEDTIMSIAIKAGLEMPQPRWWRKDGYE